MTVRYTDSRNFVNYSDNIVSIMLKPGEVVRVRENGCPSDYGDYSGEEFGTEIKVRPYARVETLVSP